MKMYLFWLGKRLLPKKPLYIFHQTAWSHNLIIIKISENCKKTYTHLQTDSAPVLQMRTTHQRYCVFTKGYGKTKCLKRINNFQKLKIVS